MKYNFKKICSILLIIYLSLTALVAIGIFISGKFGEMEVKTLLTTLAIGGYSLTGLSNVALWNKQPRHLLAILGIIFSLLGLFTTIGIIWNIHASQPIIQTFLTLLVLSISTAHASLLLGTCATGNKIVRIILYTTLFFISLVAALLIYLIFEIESIPGDAIYRVLGVFLVLDVLGTLVASIGKKMYGVTDGKNAR
jgi:hypothetical protein